MRHTTIQPTQHPTDNAAGRNFLVAVVVPCLVLILALSACGPGSSAETEIATNENSTPTVAVDGSDDVDEQSGSDGQSGDPADPDGEDPEPADPSADTDDLASGESDGENPDPNPTDDAPDDLATPGEPLDFGPAFGSPLVIVGVAYDDVLNFRTEPSPAAPIVSSFAPLHGDLDMFSLGEAWSAPSGVWWKVNVAGDEAWANQAYLGMIATEQDLFNQAAQVIQILKFEDVESAALAVADVFASTEPQSRIEFAGEPLAFDNGVGFAIVDVLDLGDDALKGWRLRVTVELVYDEASGEEGAQDIAFVVLTEVTGKPICGRGVNGGACL